MSLLNSAFGWCGNVPDRVISLSLLRVHAQAAHATSYDDPWRIGKEPRSRSYKTTDVALKSGVHTILTLGEYFDGGSDDQDAALAFIAAADPVTVLALIEAVEAAQALVEYTDELITDEWGEGPDSPEMERARAALAVFGETDDRP